MTYGEKMTYLRASLLIVLLVITAFSQSKEPQAARVVGTRVSLKPPLDFKPASQFPGYGLESFGSSIVVTEIPGPFSEVSAGFSDSMALMKKGMSALNKQEVKINGQSGLLVQIRHILSVGEFLKWILVFGDEKESVIVTATLPKEFENKLSEKMKASILTATWDREKNISPTEGLNFTVSEKGDLKLAKRFVNMLAFTKGGIFPDRAIDNPFFTVGQSISKYEISDTEAFARSRILQTTGIADIEIEQSSKVTIDNLNGYEMVARGKDKESGQPMVIYQTILFESQSYYIMLGVISNRQRETYLTLYRETARSFKRS
jgi:hypothetical protein